MFPCITLHHTLFTTISNEENIQSEDNKKKHIIDRVNPKRMDTGLSSGPSTAGLTSSTLDSNEFADLQVDKMKEAMKKQDFWKYHVIKINPLEFYLTTIPDKRHEFTRHAPSYYVQVQLPEGKATKGWHTKSQTVSGFKLIFTQQQWGVGDENKVNPFIIELLPESESGKFIMNAYQNEQLINNAITNTIGDENNGRIPLNLTFEKIKAPSSYFGREVMLHSGYRLGSGIHICSLRPGRKRDFIFKSRISGMKLAKDGTSYFLDEEFFPKSSWFNPVVAIFRPCKRGITNKITKKVVTSSAKFSSLAPHSSITIGNSDLTSVSSPATSRNSFSSTREESEDEDEDSGNEYITYSDYETSTRYYISKDGLRDRHPVDDSPSDYKLGWITIYDRDKYFSPETHGGGNWEVVLGMTFAVGFSGLIDQVIKSSRI